jgi:hypothetical protein
MYYNKNNIAKHLSYSEEGLKGKRGDDIEDAVGDLVGPL